MRHVLVPDSSIRWVPWAVARARRLIRQNRPSAILVTSPPHSSALIGALLKRVFRLPLVLDFRDDWVDTPWFKKKNPAQRSVERLLERWVVRSADKVILVTKWSLNTFRSRYPGLPKSRFAYIPNGCDLEDFPPPDAEMEKRDPPVFSIVHTGLVPPWGAWNRDPSGFFRAVSRLRAKDYAFRDDVRIEFTGTLPAPHREAVEKYGLTDVVEEHGHLPHARFRQLLWDASLLLAINYNNFSTLIPGKIYEYWAAGKAPILLLGARGAASELIAEHGIGFHTTPDDVPGIEAILRNTYAAHRRGDPIVINRDAIEEYDRKNLSLQLDSLLNSLIKRERPLGQLP